MARKTPSRKPLIKGSNESVELFEFAWFVPDSGYRVIPVRPKEAKNDLSDRYGIWDGAYPFEDRAGDYHHPLVSFPALFREFASIEADAMNKKGWTSMCAFAGNHGLLGINESAHQLDKLFSRTKGELITCEYTDDWEDEIWRMAEAVTLLDALHSSDAESLGKLVFWESEHRVTVKLDKKLGRDTPLKIHPRKTMHYTVANSHTLMERYGLSHGDIFGPVQVCLSQIVNDKLHGAMRAAILHDTETHELKLRMVPTSLLGAMWLQLSQELTGGIKSRQCAECGKWFEISLEQSGFRRNRQYCSDGCRMAAYRRRKERAVQLATEGIKPDQIAKELDSDPKTVRGWIKKAKEDRRK